MAPTKSRPLGVIEQGWCRAVAGGTGTTVVAFLSKEAPDASRLRNALCKIQNTHPVLRSAIHTDPASPTGFSFVIPPSPPPLPIESFDLLHTSALLGSGGGDGLPLLPFHVVLEHELNRDTWSSDSRRHGFCDVFRVCLYALPEGRWALVLRFHTAACDRTTAVGMLRELAELTAAAADAVPGNVAGRAAMASSIEELIPKVKASKALWTRGVDVLGYSVKSLRLSNLKFDDAKSRRSSEVVRLQMDQNETARLLLVSTLSI